MKPLDRKKINRMVSPQSSQGGNGGGQYTPSSQSTDWSDIQNKPTTIAGYGITDAYWANQQSTSDKRNLTIGSVTQQVITAHQSLNGYATEQWVGQQGFATQTWVGQQGYLTSSSLNGYATQTWVGNNYLPLSGGTITGNLTVNQMLTCQSVEIGNDNEINCSYGGGLHLQYRSNYNLTLCNGGGNVGIGTTSPSYKLHVAGKIYCTGGFAFLSDIRKKNVVGFCNGFGVKDIANAPLIQYTLRGDLDDGRRHIGSVAQYWQKVLPDTVNEVDDTLSMDQESILMASVITLARKVVSLENQIIQLKVKGYGKQ